MDVTKIIVLVGIACLACFIIIKNMKAKKQESKTKSEDKNQ